MKKFKVNDNAFHVAIMATGKFTDCRIGKDYYGISFTVVKDGKLKYSYYRGFYKDVDTEEKFDKIVSGIVNTLDSK